MSPDDLMFDILADKYISRYWYQSDGRTSELLMGQLRDEFKLSTLFEDLLW